MIQKILRTITGKFHLEGMNLGDYRKMKVRGLTFQIYAFHAEGLGHVSAMSASGFFGLMKMDTLIINPTQRDLPLLSYDRVYAMGNDTLIVELYDTMLGEADMTPLDSVKGRATALPDHDLGSHWYDSLKMPQSLSKKGKKVRSPAFDDVAMQYLNAFLAMAERAECCDIAAKQEKASVYVEGLLEQGGPSTDVFRKGIGPERTAELFRRFLFGTQM
jgi:hypothetical protein